MKSINLLSLIQAHCATDAGLFSRFAEYHGIHIKEEEIQDLRILVEKMREFGVAAPQYQHFYVGYKIPQIGKEFDLLRFGSKSIINVEIKSSGTEDKIKKQLVRNRYYLKFAGRSVYNFSFISGSRELYILNDSGDIEIVGFDMLNLLLADQKVDYLEDVDHLFEPSDYLVSPFNSTERFARGEYFLTHQQEEVRTSIVNAYSKKSGTTFYAVTGAAGTGKTLLAYDVVRSLKEDGINCIIIHCGQLNKGHAQLTDAGWSIRSIRDLRHCILTDFAMVVVDEAQRIRPGQLDTIVKAVSDSGGSCIFSYDSRQTLSLHEAQFRIAEKVEQLKPLNLFRLSEKIRTNKEISNFIRGLFDNRYNSEKSHSQNITLSYFDSVGDAQDFLRSIDEERWQRLKFTPSQYDVEYHESYSNFEGMNSHEVIGQEFDGALVVMDKHFTYDKKGSLSYNGDAYYSPYMMLFQNITRARKRLHVVVIENETILNRCLELLD